VTGPGCPAHGSLAEQLRDYAGEALDAIEPFVERIRAQPPEQDQPEPTSCAACPVCALITVLHGGRSELAVRLAEQAAELVALLRAALAEKEGTRDQQSPRPTASPPGPSGPRAHRARRAPRVQRIQVDRDGRWPAGAYRREPC
jgi:hypothetical protein